MSKYTLGTCINNTGCKVGPIGPTGANGISDRYLTTFSSSINSTSVMDYFYVEPGLAYMNGHKVMGSSISGISLFNGVVNNYNKDTGLISISYTYKNPAFLYDTIQDFNLNIDNTGAPGADGSSGYTGSTGPRGSPSVLIQYRYKNYGFTDQLTIGTTVEQKADTYELSITPQSSDSLIKVQFQVKYTCGDSSGNRLTFRIKYAIAGGSSGIVGDDIYLGPTGSSTPFQNIYFFNFIHHPNTTGVITYSLYYELEGIS